MPKLDLITLKHEGSKHQSTLVENTDFIKISKLVFTTPLTTIFAMMMIGLKMMVYGNGGILNREMKT